MNASDTEQGLSPDWPVTLERDDDGNKGLKELSSPSWPPEVIDQRLQQLTNGRWLRSWQRRGDKEIHQPLIDEIDQSGVNRHLISRVIPPETLKQLEAQAHRERKRLCERQSLDPTVSIWSFQHLLLQSLQAAVIEQQGEPVPVCPPPLWARGDRVSYCGEKYTIGNVTTKKLSLVSEVSGEVDVFLNSPDLAKLKKLLSP